MPSTHTKLLYHIIFSTKHREPVLAVEWRPELHHYLGGTVNGLDAQSLGVGGVNDHVHLLVSLKATHRLSDFMRELKKASSSWIRETKGLEQFHWQEGYAAFSVSPSAIDSVKHYIARQEEHHQKKGFLDELTEYLKKSQVDYDPRYLE